MKSVFTLSLVALALAGCSSTSSVSSTAPSTQESESTQVQSTAEKKGAKSLRTKYTITSGGDLKPEHQAIMVNHADLSFKIFPETHRVEGESILTLAVLNDISQVKLDLDSQYDITKVAINGKVLAAGDYSNPEGQLTIDLPTAVSKGEEVKVTIAYNGVPLQAIRAPWDGGYVWSESKDGHPWIATAVQGEGCDIIWPCIDHSLREPLSVDMHLTVPAPLAAAANGKFMGKEQQGDWNTYHWKTLDSINTYAIALNIGHYDLLRDEYQSRFGNTIDLQYWHLKDQQEGAKTLFAEFSQILDFFEQVIGPYPFGGEKMGVVDTPHLGMEHQTINAYGNQYKVDRFGFDWLLHHEFAHEWFGNQLTHQNLDDMWLHEGYGTYMQSLYAQYLYGDMFYKEHIASLRRRIHSNAPVVAGRSMTEQEVYVDGPGSDIYNKGAVFLHTLRQLIGDEAFFAATREIVYGTADPKPGNFKPHFASTQDLIDIVNRVTGKDLTWVFKGYLYQKNLPKLVEKRQGDRLTLEWQVGENADLTFPMPVEVQVNGEVKIVDMSDNRGSIAVNQSDLVIVDPQAKLLRDQPFVDAFRKAETKNRNQRQKEFKQMEKKLKTYQQKFGELTQD